MYNCPKCGAQLIYNIKHQRLYCESCNGKFTVEEIDDRQDTEDSSFDVNAFHCKHCGGDIYSNDNTIAGFCSYCGASAMLEKRVEKYYAPKYVYPFLKTKEDCKDLFKEYVKGQSYVPNEFKEDNAQREFRGIYIPYHTYKGTMEGVLKTKAESEKSIKKDSKRYKKVTIYDVTVTAKGAVNNITHDASDAFRDDLSETIDHGTDSSARKEFHPGYLSGFYADKADRNEADYFEYAKMITQNGFNEKFEKRVNDLRYKKPSSEPTPSVEFTGDVLKPVWFMSYRNKNRMAYTTVNGRTGEIYSDLPVDTKKFLLVSIILSLIFFAGLTIFENVLFPMSLMLVIAVISNFITMKYFVSNLYKTYNRDIKRDYSYKNNMKFVKIFGDRRLTAVLMVVGMLAFPVLMFLASILIAMVYIIFTMLLEVFNYYIHIKVNFYGFICIIFTFIQISYFAKSIDEFVILWKNGTKLFPFAFMLPMASAFATYIAVTLPVYDIWYYFATGICMGINVINLFGMIRDYNICSTRPLPQFELYKGGNHRG